MSILEQTYLHIFEVFAFLEKLICTYFGETHILEKHICTYLHIFWRNTYFGETYLHIFWKTYLHIFIFEARIYIWSIFNISAILILLFAALERITYLHVFAFEAFLTSRHFDSFSSHHLQILDGLDKSVLKASHLIICRFWTDLIKVFWKLFILSFADFGRIWWKCFEIKNSLPFQGLLERKMQLAS